MKTYPSIALGLRITLYSGVLMLLIAAYSVVCFFFDIGEALRVPVYILDILACTGLAAGMMFCVRSDKKYMPALGLAVASMVLSIVAMVSSFATSIFFIWFIQCFATWLCIYLLCSRTSQLLMERDKPNASFGDKLSLLVLIPCAIRYYTFGRSLGVYTDGIAASITYVPFGVRLGGAVVCLAVTVVIDCMLLRYLNTASALLSYQTKTT